VQRWLLPLRCFSELPVLDVSYTSSCEVKIIVYLRRLSKRNLFSNLSKSDKFESLAARLVPREHMSAALPPPPLVAT